MKKKTRVVIENLFDDTEDLISDTPKSDASESPAALGKRRKLTPEVRQERFNDLYQSVLPHLGKRPQIKLPMRHSNWVNLISLASSAEQLERISDLFPSWKDGGHELNAHASELFIRRCEELNCPQLALKVFGDYPKYSVKLTLPGARHLLHSLHMEHSIADVMTASALYHVYNLPPIAKDLVSCSLVLAACLKDNSRAAVQVATGLLPALRLLMESHKPSSVKVTKSARERPQEKPRIWVKWALKKIDRALALKQGNRVDWLAEWRRAMGHAST